MQLVLALLTRPHRVHSGCAAGSAVSAAAAPSDLPFFCAVGSTPTLTLAATPWLSSTAL